MKKKFYIISALAVLTAMVAVLPTGTKGKNAPAQSIYSIKAKTIDGKEIEFSEYKGKVLLIVNVASKCGFTPQYKGLQELYDKYKSRGFEILAFPCNQFNGQEPGTNKQIKEFCSVNYNVTFQLMDKIDVNGEKAHPLYQLLTKSIGDNNPIKWNFTKFLIDTNGVPIARFESNTLPEHLTFEIENAFDGGKK